MTINPLTNTTSLSNSKQPSEYDRTFFQTITQIAVRILFPVTAIWIFSSVVPIGFSAIALVGIGTAAATLASLFFQEPNYISNSEANEFPSFLNPGLGFVLSELPPYPQHFPRGINNASMNCGINSAAQAIRCCPSLYHWLSQAGYNEFEPIRRFFQSYEDSIRHNRNTVEASSQDLRVALSRLTNAIPPDMRVQIDPADALAAICNHLPRDMRGSIRETKHWDTSKNGPMLHNPQGITTTVPQDFFILPLVMTEEGPVRLDQMIEQHLNDRNQDTRAGAGIERYPEDGLHLVRYPLLQTERTIVDPPQILVVNVKRYNNPGAPQSILSSFLNESNGRINRNPIVAGDVISLPTESGRNCDYRLKAFTTHIGNTEGGHHTATGEMANGERFHMNDRVVHLVQPEEWEQRKAQASVYIYERI